ncbi:hypothetical protein Taro_048124, partial [Colocasia esculenta]|nr:hypothetical protein [Colocasia esculenta]
METFPPTSINRRNIKRILMPMKLCLFLPSSPIHTIFVISFVMKHDYSFILINIFRDGLYKPSIAQAALDRAENDSEAGAEFSKTLSPSAVDDISVLSFQRLQQYVPSTPLDMVVDYY